MAKPTAPVRLDLVLLEGGEPGGRARIRLSARPWNVRARLDLDLRLPPGIELVSGASSRATTVAGPGDERILEAEVRLPAEGRYRILGAARMEGPGGQVWFRGVELDLPAVPGKPDPGLPVVALPGGGSRVELRGESP